MSKQCAHIMYTSKHVNKQKSNILGSGFLSIFCLPSDIFSNKIKIIANIIPNVIFFYLARIDFQLFSLSKMTQKSLVFH